MPLTRLQFKADPERQFGKSPSSGRQSRAAEAPPRLGPPETRSFLRLQQGQSPEPRRGRQQMWAVQKSVEQVL